MNKKIVFVLALMACVCLSVMVFLFRDLFIPPVSVTYRNMTDLTDEYNADKEIAEAHSKLRSSNEKAGVISGIYGGQRNIAITFDGLSDRTTMLKILDLLKTHNLKATFFVDGLQTVEDPQAVVSINKEGYKVENYTLSGIPHMEQLPPERMVRDFCQAQKIITVTTDNKANLLKCNNTQYTDAVLLAAKACGFNGVVKSDVVIDATIPGAADGIAGRVRPGSIVSVRLEVNPEPIVLEPEVSNLRPEIDKKPGLKPLPKVGDNKNKVIIATVEKVLVDLKNANYTTVYVEDVAKTRVAAAPFDKLTVLLSALRDEVEALFSSRTAFAAEGAPVHPEEIHTILTAERAMSFSFGGLSDRVAVGDILNKLQKMDIKATFFVTEQEMRRYPDTVKSIIRNGHEIGVSMRANPPETVAEARKELVDLRAFLRNQFGVTANLVRQSSGAIPDTTKAAIAAENCVLIGQAYNIVQSKHKDYKSPEQVVSELFGQFDYAFMRGQIIYFRLDFYTDNTLVGKVMEMVKKQRVDNIAFSTVYDNPQINPKNDTQMEIKPIGAILSNKQEQYTIPVDKDKIPHNLRSGAHTFTVNDSNFIEAARKRYLGNFEVDEGDRIIGFSKMSIRRLDKTGTVHTNDNVIFLSFDDWGSEASLNKLLYVLKKHNATATFFIITRTVPPTSNILRRIALDGHEIASHSDLHKPMAVRDPKTGRQIPSQTREELYADYARSYKVLEEITGDVIVNGKPSLTRLFRPPTLAISKQGFEALFDNSYEWIVSGSYSTKDYMAASAEEVVNNLKYGIYDKHGRLQKGATIVMHMGDATKYTAIALDILLTINDRKADSDPTKFRTGRLTDYLTADYDQSKPFKPLK